MELRDYIRVLSARRWTVIVAIVFFALAALAASALKPVTYTAEARVLVSGSDAASSLLGVTGMTGFQPDREMQTHAQLARSPEVVAQVIRELKLPFSQAELTKQVTVEPVEGSDILAIRVTDTVPRRAATTADAFARAYVNQLAEAQRKSIAAAEEELLRQQKTATTQLGKLGSYESKQPEREVMIATLSRINEQLERVRTGAALDLGGARVVGKAQVPAEAEASALSDAVLGIAFGLVVGVGMAFGMHHFDTRIRSPRDVATAGLRVAGAVPADRRSRNASTLTTVREPGSVGAEAYRLLRRVVISGRSGGVLLVTTPKGFDPSALVASNLAVSLVQGGSRVALVDCDFKHSAVRTLFDLPGSAGLSDLLLGMRATADVVQYPGQQRLMVVPAGPPPPTPSELLASQRMRAVLDEIERGVDWVIVNSPGLLEDAATVSVMTWSKALLLVLVAGETRAEQVHASTELIQRASNLTADAVVWGVPPGDGVIESYFSVPVPSDSQSQSATSVESAPA